MTSDAYSGPSRFFPMSIIEENIATLLQEFADSITRNESPLHWAVTLHSPEIVTILLDAGADLLELPWVLNRLGRWI